MKFPRLAFLILALVVSVRGADTGAPTSPVVIKELLLDFLTHNSDPARHENFWADDLVYTSSAALVTTKPEIMKEVRADAEGVQPTYMAEDINIRPYDGFAALTFRLVAHMPDGTVSYYRNSGTFIFRDGRWQVITWQATKVPPAASPSPGKS